MMKSHYIVPKVTVVPFKIESGYEVSITRVESDRNLVEFLFHSDNSGGRFGNDQFNNVSNNDNNYNFFGD